MRIKDLLRALKGIDPNWQVKSSQDGIVTSYAVEAVLSSSGEVYLCGGPVDSKGLRDSIDRDEKDPYYELKFNQWDRKTAEYSESLLKASAQGSKITFDEYEKLSKEDQNAYVMWKKLAEYKMGRPKKVEEEASEIVRDGEREKGYGHPKENFTRIATLWGPIVGHDITPEQVALMLNQLKVARLINDPSHHDSMVDAIGYMVCLQRLVEGD